MARWAEFEAEEPDLAARVNAILTGRKHHTLATLRKDDPPEANQGAWQGDAKVAGTLVQRTVQLENQSAGNGSWLDIVEIALTHLDEAATQLEIESWHPRRGREITKRA